MLFASPRHLMNHLKKYRPEVDITINYLNQCVYKRIYNAKGLELNYISYNLLDPAMHTVYDRIASLVRSGEGYILGVETPLDRFNNVIKPLLDKRTDPVQDAVNEALKEGIGTEKDYEEMIKNAAK